MNYLFCQLSGRSNFEIYYDISVWVIEFHPGDMLVICRLGRNFVWIAVVNKRGLELATVTMGYNGGNVCG